MRRTILLCLLALPACGPVAAPTVAVESTTDRAFGPLLSLIRDRLDVMHEVARWKWARKAPIEDPEREAALLKDVTEKGAALGIDSDLTRAFFLGQIEAAKVIQRADFARWEADQRGPGGEAPDLANVLRPRIDRLNSDLLKALAAAEPRLREEDGAARLRSLADRLLGEAGYGAEVRDPAVRPLTNLGR